LNLLGKLLYYKTVFGKKLKYGKKFRFRSSLKLLIEPGGKVIFGDNCVIGANCLIYKDVPSGSIVKHKEDLMIIRENEEL